jgi:hypothetical protein
MPPPSSGCTPVPGGMVCPPPTGTPPITGTPR